MSVTVTNCQRAMEPDRYVPEADAQDGPVLVACDGPYFGPDRCLGHGLSWDFTWDGHGWICPVCQRAYEEGAVDSW